MRTSIWFKRIHTYLLIIFSLFVSSQTYSVATYNLSYDDILNSFFPFKLHKTHLKLADHEEKTYNSLRELPLAYRNSLFPNFPQNGDIRWYHVLGIKNPTLEKIKKSARNLMLKTHPDKTLNNNTTPIFMLVKEAQEEGLQALEVFVEEKKEYRRYTSSNIFFKSYEYYFSDKKKYKVPLIPKEKIEELFNKEDAQNANILRLFHKRVQRLESFASSLFILPLLGSFAIGYLALLRFNVNMETKPKTVDPPTFLSKWERKVIRAGTFAWGGIMFFVGAWYKYIARKPNISPLEEKSIREVDRKDNIKLFELHNNERGYVENNSELDKLIEEQKTNRGEYLDLYEGLNLKEASLISMTRSCMITGAAIMAITVALSLKKSTEINRSAQDKLCL